MIITRPCNVAPLVQARWSDTENGYYLIRFAAPAGAMRRVPVAFSTQLFPTLDASIAAHDTGLVTWMEIGR